MKKVLAKVLFFGWSTAHKNNIIWYEGIFLIFPILCCKVCWKVRG